MIYNCTECKYRQVAGSSTDMKSFQLIFQEWCQQFQMKFTIPSAHLIEMHPSRHSLVQPAMETEQYGNDVNVFTHYSSVSIAVEFEQVNANWNDIVTLHKSCLHHQTKTPDVKRWKKTFPEFDTFSNFIISPVFTKIRK